MATESPPSHDPHDNPGPRDERARRVRRAIPQTVQVAIARAHAARADTPYASIPRRRAGPPSTSLLLAEDDAEVRAIMVVVLRNAGFAVDGVGTRAEAEARLASRTYDALILDALLPDGSGIDMASEWGGRGVKALVVTGSPEAMLALEARGLPYLPKPFRAVQIVGKIDRLLTGAEA